MTTLTTRADKGSPLTNNEMDANLTNLNTYKCETTNNLSDLADTAAARTNLGLVIGSNVQAQDADLQALADNATNGILTKTGVGTVASRTITAGTGITVSNGDGVSGNPTIANDGVLSVGGAKGVLTLGSGLSMAGNTLSVISSSGVSTFNTRTGDITLSSSDVVSAIGYTPVSQNMAHGAIGSLCFAYLVSGGVIPGGTVAGSTLKPTCVNGTASSYSTTLSGTWRCLGHGLSSNCSVWQRIS